MKFLILLALLVHSNTGKAESAKHVTDSIKKAAVQVGVPANLLKAICISESNLNTKAYVHADGGSANHAIGICQVLVRTAEEHGFSDGEGCYGGFEYKECKLFQPFTNALYAAKYLKSKLVRYDGSWINAIAAYNSGTLKTCPKDGYYISYRNGTERLSKPRKVPCTPGELLNRKYVDRVLKALWGE